MVDEVLYDIPIEYRDRYKKILDGEDTIPLADLRQSLEKYVITVRQVSQLVKLLDLSEAERLAETGMLLLESVTTEDSHRVVQAAIRYFILEEDDEEITGVLGFDDDIQVMNAVARGIGRTDLVLDLKRRE